MDQQRTNEDQQYADEANDRADGADGADNGTDETAASQFELLHPLFFSKC